MRAVWGLLVVLLATPALAADWGHYDNARFGYGIDVPPGFAGQGESDNGDGQVFASPTAKLTVFGQNIVEGDFETAVRTQQDFATQDGLAISYQVTTPTKASFSGKQSGRIVYARMIALCGGSAFAMFELRYGTADVAKFDAVVDRLVASFGGAC